MRVQKIDRVTIDADKMTWRGAIPGLSLQEMGQLVSDLCQACERNDAAWVLGQDYVKGVHVGSYHVPVGRILRRSMPLATRRLILSRGVCAACGSTEELQVDHIKAYSEGGTHDPTNLQCLCRTCNRKKGPQAWSRVNAEA